MYTRCKDVMSPVNIVTADSVHPPCVCVCLLSAIHLLPGPVTFPVKGHSTWVDNLSLTSATN